VKSIPQSKSQKNQSLLGFNWQKKTFDERASKAIFQKYNISPIVSDLLSSRIHDLSEVEQFLDPKLKNLLPDPYELGGMSKAVDTVLKAIENNQKITIFADYDVDGATSAAILKRFLLSIGYDAQIYVPDRVKEGYGPNSQALINLKESGTDLIITLDCGTVSFEPLLTANKIGLDVIVIDHHLGVFEKPKAIAIINPNQIGEKFPHKNLCAAGVTFLFIVALNKKLREDGFYQKITEPNLVSFLDLVALGTVCDVMELRGLNRAFVTQGLKILKQRQNAGIKAICDIANLDEKPNSYHLGFVIGPRINAGGRIGKSDLGANLLSSNDEIEAFEIASQLEKCNQERKEIESQALRGAIESLQNGIYNFNEKDDIIFAISYEWHQGIIGIIASRLKDLYNKPVAVITIDKETKIGKASCRSITGIDFGSQIINAKASDLILEGGGHAMAGGFMVFEDRIEDLHHFFCQNLAKKVSEINNQKIRNYDVEIDLSQVNCDLLREINSLEPFGIGNPKPKFFLKNVRKISAKVVGNDQSHISCIFSSKEMIKTNQIQAMLFRGVGSDLEPILLGEGYSKVMSLIGTLNINSWMGVKRVQMIIEDICI